MPAINAVHKGLKRSPRFNPEINKVKKVDNIMDHVTNLENSNKKWILPRSVDHPKI